MKKKVVDLGDVPLSTFVIDESASTLGTAHPPVSRMRLAIANNTFQLNLKRIMGLTNQLMIPHRHLLLLLPIKKVCPTLKQLKLPYQKRYSGRPLTSKLSHFANYTKAPKLFLFKNTSEKNKMFLSWIIGFEKILKRTRKIEEEEIISIPENVSNAIIVEIIFSSHFFNCFLRELEIFLMNFWKTGFRQLRERPFSFISW